MNSTHASSIKWQGQRLSSQETKEHFDAITYYDIKRINRGHLTSICDSFLLLICHLLNINIYHSFLGTKIIYSINNPRKTLYFKSSRGHFSRGK